MTRTIIVLGTDTDVGKTTFSLLFLASFHQDYEYWKPVETGDSDTETIRRLIPAAVVHSPLARFRDPVAPPLAASREGRECPSAATLLMRVPTPTTDQRSLLIETFGGPLSPLNNLELQIEWIRQLHAKTVLVGSTSIGAIGRVLSTWDALAGYGILPEAVVLVGEPDAYAASQMSQHRPATVFALVPPRERDPQSIHESSQQQRAELSNIVQLLNRSDGKKSWPLPSAILQSDQQTIWHPYTSLQAAAPLPVVGAKDEFLCLADGRRLIDAISSWWTILHGHCHPLLMATLREASRSIDHVVFAGITHPAATQFAERILRTCPWTGGRVFFSDNGSTAVEVALKMAYLYWHHQGETQRTRFIGFEHAYHGDTFGAMSVGRDRLFFGPFEPLLFQATQLPLEPNRLDEYLSHQSHHVAGIIIEPLIQGAGGMRMHSPDTLQAIADIAQRYGIVLIADEVMTGNRTGQRWAFQHAGIQPDLICASKTLTGGIMPLAVTLASPKIVKVYDTTDRTKTFFHGHSFTAHPLACAVAAVNEELVAQPGTLDQANRIGDFFAQRWAKFQDHPHVHEIRMLGSVVACELKSDASYLSSETERWKEVALRHGVFLRPLGNVLYVMPPLNTSANSLDVMASCIEDCICL